MFSLTSTLLRLDPPAPNPATDIATLRFGIPFASIVALELLDDHGRIAHTIIDGPMMEGEYAIDMPTSELSSGVYHVRLRMGDAVRRERVVVVK
ncbi:MAG: T9SS type A sorting domain-containing protein [bacterium]|nr:T9SS type A sorting domain-containing protein [Candidatus Kapabacteria bacterium]